VLREQINSDLKEALKAGDKPRVSTLRLINSAFKNADIDARGQGKTAPSHDDLLGLLQKMIKQGQESVELYEKGGRADLARQERAEMAIIAGYLPKQMSPDETRAAIETVIAEVGAEGMRDMGRVMAALKERFAGRMDFSKASGEVKALLGS